MLDLRRCQRAVEDSTLAVGGPFLEHLVAAELVAPDGGGDVAPEGAGVQVHVERGLAEGGEGVAQGVAFLRREGAFDDAALAGHDRAARSVVAPSGGEREVAAGHVAPVRGRGHGDGGGLRTERTRGDARNGVVGVEEAGQLAAPRGGSGERLRRLPPAHLPERRGP